MIDGFIEKLGVCFYVCRVLEDKEESSVGIAREEGNAIDNDPFRSADVAHIMAALAADFYIAATCENDGGCDCEEK